LYYDAVCHRNLINEYIYTADYVVYRQACRKSTKDIFSARASYYKTRISESSGNSRDLWRTDTPEKSIQDKTIRIRADLRNLSPSSLLISSRRSAPTCISTTDVSTVPVHPCCGSRRNPISPILTCDQVRGRQAVQGPT